MHGLDVRSIRSQLHWAVTALVEEVELFDKLDSTNEYLLKKCRGVSPARCCACLTEEQTAGRGRRGRIWISPPRANLYLSLSWRLGRDLTEMTAVTMMLAFAVAEVLSAIGVSELEIKWPNDLLWRNRKLAGMLVEVCGSPGNRSIVVGLGLNVNMPSQASTAIGQAWVDLKTILSVCPDRNQLAGSMINAFVETLSAVDRTGIPPLAGRWLQWGAYQGQIVELRTPRANHSGRLTGIDDQGRLLLEIDGVLHAFNDGEASLRMAP